MNGVGRRCGHAERERGAAPVRGPQFDRAQTGELIQRPAHAQHGELWQSPVYDRGDDPGRGVPDRDDCAGTCGTLPDIVGERPVVAGQGEHAGHLHLLGVVRLGGGRRGGGRRCGRPRRLRQRRRHGHAHHEQRRPTTARRASGPGVRRTDRPVVRTTRAGCRPRARGRRRARRATRPRRGSPRSRSRHQRAAGRRRKPAPGRGISPLKVMPGMPPDSVGLPADFEYVRHGNNSISAAKSPIPACVTCVIVLQALPAYCAGASARLTRRRGSTCIARS